MAEIISNHILNHQAVSDRINRIAWQIYEDSSESKNVILAGIAERGYLLAKKLAEKLTEISPLEISTHRLKINKEQPLNIPPQMEPEIQDFKNSTVIVVDDVLNSGSTLIYGVRHFLQFEIREIKTAVLVDRNHKKFPVKADYKGLSLSTSMMEHISVNIETEPYSVVLS